MNESYKISITYTSQENYMNLTTLQYIKWLMRHKLHMHINSYSKRDIISEKKGDIMDKRLYTWKNVLYFMHRKGFKQMSSTPCYYQNSKIIE